MNELLIPPAYQQVMPYLIVKDALSFLRFASDVFNAKEKMKIMRSEGVIMHAELTIGESVIMLAESTDQFPPQNAGLFVYVADADETYQRAIDSGATIITAMSNQDYGRSGGIKDPFGNHWWITSPL